MDDEVQEHDEEIVDEAMRKLRQHFDTVQVFVTRDEPNQNTLAFAIGTGNWYARYGQVVEWLENGGTMHVTEEDQEP